VTTPGHASQVWRNKGIPLQQPTSWLERELPQKHKLIHEIQTLLLDKLAIRIDSAETDLFHSGVLDSSAQVHLMLHLEKHFGVCLPMDSLEIDSFSSVAKIAELVADTIRIQTSLADPVHLNGSNSSQRNDLAGEIRELFLDKLSIRVESADVNLFQTGIFDSMTLVQFIFYLEEHFGIHLQMEDIDVDTFQSVATISELVGNHAEYQRERVHASGAGK
jgi:acyl carrier protein